ncbi:MAG: hypothetical protein ACHQQQ_05505 [Bacteroidota bacterium]
MTRSFTAYQTEAALTIKLTRFAQTSPCRLAVILGLLDTYYDEQVKLAECRQSLCRVFRTLRMLTRQNVHIVVADVEVTGAPAGKDTLFGMLRSAADTVIILEQTQNGLRFNTCRERRRTTLWDETTTPSPLS